MMDIEITVNYDTPAEEFDQLANAYPLGEYMHANPKCDIRWFRLTIHTPTDKIKLTWFRSWTE